jgi:hypothetical protein
MSTPCAENEHGVWFNREPLCNRTRAPAPEAAAFIFGAPFIAAVQDFTALSACGSREIMTLSCVCPAEPDRFADCKLSEGNALFSCSPPHLFDHPHFRSALFTGLGYNISSRSFEVIIRSVALEGSCPTMQRAEQAATLLSTQQKKPRAWPPSTPQRGYHRNTHAGALTLSQNNVYI